MGTLQVVATPIGNLEDISARALRCIAEADLLFAEDTRRTRILLERFQIDAKAVSLHEHNEASRIHRALEVLECGGVVALVSDAGTPLVSDPGARLVSATIDAGHRVESVPGASALLSALTVSGLAVEPFSFIGFLPRRSGPRRALLDSYLGRPETLVLFESPRRVKATLTEMADKFGQRRGIVAREMTKLHEEVIRGTLAELAGKFAHAPRGEITIVVEGAGEEEAGREAFDAPSEEELTNLIRDHLAAGRRPREIAAELAQQTGAPRRQVYAKVLALKEKS
jgi:16S rRNA (cytidine1402-2'-O)-methyltransferase